MTMRSDLWSSARGFSRRTALQAAIVGGTFALLRPRLAAAAPAFVQATARDVYYAAILGHNIANWVLVVGGSSLSARFLDYYNNTGGLERWGHPTSEAVVEDDVLCQYFQRGVIEWAPTSSGYLVSRRLAWDYFGGGVVGSPDLGTEPGQSNPFGGEPIGPWGHVVSNQAVDGTVTGFLDFYNRLGGVDSFGFPKTEARVDTADEATLFIESASLGFVRQYFQAAVMEHHPGTDQPVRLRLLGDDLRDRLYPGGIWTYIKSFRRADPLPAGALVALEATQRGSGLLHTTEVKAPTGYATSVFAETPAGVLPVALDFGPDGVLYVSLSNDTVATYRDTSGDGVADVMSVFASGEVVSEPRGVAFANGNVYVSARRKIVRVRDATGTGTASEFEDIVTGLHEVPLLLHRNNGIAIGPDGRLYIGQGSSSNVGELQETETSGSILRCELDGSGLVRFATGLRNPFGVAFAPNGDLFATDNGPDSGSRTVDDSPDELNHIIEGADYGHARYWGTPPDGTGTRGPVALLPAHAAASGLTIYTGVQAGEFANNILIATWGPGAGRSSYAHNILRVALQSSGDSYIGTAVPFITGLNRATDVAIGPDGSIYVADHTGRRIYRFRRTAVVG